MKKEKREKIMKRILTIYLLLAMIIVSLSGCERSRDREKNQNFSATEAEPDGIRESSSEGYTDEYGVDDMDTAYWRICEERLSQYGEGNFESALDENVHNYLSGLGVVRLMDFDGNGVDELLLIYMKDYDIRSGWYGCCEIWTYHDGKAIQAYDSEIVPSGYSGVWQQFIYQNRGDVLLINKSYQNSDNSKNVESREELWGLNGDKFQPEAVLVLRGTSLYDPTDNRYYFNDAEITDTEHQEKLTHFYDQSELIPLHLINPSGTDSDKLYSVLTETRDVLKQFGYSMDVGDLYPTAPTTETPPETKTSYPDGISDTNSLTADMLVGEWKINWDQTGVVNDVNAQELFGTSLKYGSSMVLSTDNQITYYFSFCDGTGSYYFDGENVIVDAETSEPNTCSTIKRLTPMIFDGTLYLAMDLNDVFPEDGAAPCLILWKRCS